MTESKWSQAQSMALVLSRAAELHPSTAPAKIAAKQRSDVRLVWRALGKSASIEEVSDLTDLPVFSVRMRLFELKLGPDPLPPLWKPAEPRKRAAPQTDRVGEYVRRKGPATAKAVAAACGFSTGFVFDAFKRLGFVPVGVGVRKQVGRKRCGPKPVLWGPKP